MMAWKQSSGDQSDLSNIPVSAGGIIDFMVDAKYHHYYPERSFNSFQVSKF